MASSSIGMKELPYARLPFALDGGHVQLMYFREERVFPHEIMLISGVKSDHDVMRGEETQLIGLGTAMDLFRTRRGFHIPWYAFEAYVCPRRKAGGFQNLHDWRSV